jgi:hypothetical protein
VNRSFRYTQLHLTKLDRFHLRTVEDRHSAKVLHNKYVRLIVSSRMEFAPILLAAVAAMPQKG